MTKIPVVELPPSASTFPESADPAVETDSSPMNPSIQQSIDPSAPAIGASRGNGFVTRPPSLELRFSAVLQPLCAIVWDHNHKMTNLPAPLTPRHILRSRRPGATFRTARNVRWIGAKRKCFRGLVIVALI